MFQNRPLSLSINAALYTRVWDVADYVVPPAENGAFFVATNVIITPNQTRGFCPEDNFDVKGVDCSPDPAACDAEYNAITITGEGGSDKRWRQVRVIICFLTIQIGRGRGANNGGESGPTTTLRPRTRTA